MPDRAPGLDTSKNGGGCFNCGSQDHFAYVCPEPVRKEPHGAEAFRQRQAARNTYGTTAKGPDNSRPKSGLVVTRYAPPPSQFPPPPPPPTGPWGSTSNVNAPYPPPNPSLPPNPYTHITQPPPSLHPGYPTPVQGPPPYPTPYPPPSATGYGLPPAPPPNPGQSYGQYGQPHYPPVPPPPPPPSSYGPPPPYPPTSYSAPYSTPNSAHSGGLPPPPPPPPPPSYPSSLPAPPPPSFASGYASSVPPPPPGTFQPAPYRSGYETPAPYSHPFPPQPTQAWLPDNSGHGHSRPREQRDRRNDRDKGGRNKHNRRGNDNNQRGRGQKNDTAPPQSASNSRQHTPKPIKETKKDKSEPPTAESAVVPTTVGNKEELSEADAEFDWDLEKAFVEVKTKPADPVGKPLAAEWNDDPTIPPAYNAKCIKSAFFDPDSPDAFLASVRDTKYWVELQRDPVFRFRRGMVVARFSGSHHEYFTYRCSRCIGPNWSKEREIVPVPSDTSLVDITKPRYIYANTMLPGEADLPPKPLVNVKRSHRESDDLRRERDIKRPRTTIGRDRTPPGLPRRPSPRNFENSPRDPLSNERWSNSPRRPRSRDDHSHSPGGYRPQTSDSLRQERMAPPPYSNGAYRQDSGYHSSAHTTDKWRSRGEDNRSHKRHLSPPLPIVSSKNRTRERDVSRERDRDRDRDRDRGRGRVHSRSPERSRDRGRRDRDREERTSAWSPPYAKSHSKSRSRSPTATPAAVDGADSDSDGSNLSDLEYELLGMERPEKKKSPPRKAIPKKRVKLNEAFSRRW